MAANQKKTAKSRVYRQLRRALITGQYRSEERLGIESLAEQFGTSVSPVRDALQMLGQEGLVTIRPRSGYFVTGITFKQLTDLLDLRRILELAAIEGAAINITPAQLDQLSAIHSGYSGDDPESYVRYTDENRAYHVKLAEASGNHALAQMIGQVLDRLARFMVMGRGGRIQIDSHQHLIDALRAGDTPAAAEALRQEIRATHDRILKRVTAEAAERWDVN